jgi:hypothetical protein
MGLIAADQASSVVCRQMAMESDGLVVHQFVFASSVYQTGDFVLLNRTPQEGTLEADCIFARLRKLVYNADQAQYRAVVDVLDRHGQDKPLQWSPDCAIMSVPVNWILSKFVCVPVADKSNADCAQILHTHSGCMDKKIPFQERVFLLVVSS